jgi:hypothetical protein
MDTLSQSVAVPARRWWALTTFGGAVLHRGCHGRFLLRMRPNAVGLMVPRA